MGTGWAKQISEWHLNLTDHPCRCGKGLQNKILNAVIYWLYIIFRKFRVPMGEESLLTRIHWPFSHIRRLWVNSFLSVRADLQSNSEPSWLASSLATISDRALSLPISASSKKGVIYKHNSYIRKELVGMVLGVPTMVKAFWEKV